MSHIHALCLALLLFVQNASADTKELAPLPDEVMIAGVEFVRIPAGYFWYSVQSEYPNRRRPGTPFYREVKVWLDEYFIGKYEARARDFVRYMNSPAARQDFIGDPLYWMPESSGCAVRYLPGVGFSERYEGADFPATAVSWDLANQFARWMGFRLPNEAEWQKAARGTDRRFWPWGDEHPDDTYGNFMLGSMCAPTPVTAYPKGRSPYGAYNMSGNVVETVANWFNLGFDKALVDGVRNPMPPGEPAINDEVLWEYRIDKGGRWGTVASSIGIAMRELSRPGNWNSSSGLRFALDATGVRKHLQAGTASVLLQKR